MKRYKDFLITTEPFNAEILSSVLWQMDIDGLFEDVNCVHIYSGENSSISLDEIKNVLEKLKTEKMVSTYTVEENLLTDRNWNEEWEKTINVIKVSERIVIKPTFREYQSDKNEIIITLDPKMSFGTGEHQTTKIMLRLIEKYAGKGEKVLDVGSGTAVLAIAAVKLGASTAVAVDIDDWCFMNGRENAVLNNVEKDVDVRMGQIEDIADRNFDLILANIQKNILLEIKDAIFERTAKNGYVILSGLLDSDESDIISAYSQSGFSFVEKLQLDEWLGIVFRV